MQGQDGLTHGHLCLPGWSSDWSEQPTYMITHTNRKWKAWLSKQQDDYQWIYCRPTAMLNCVASLMRFWATPFSTLFLRPMSSKPWRNGLAMLSTTTRRTCEYARKGERDTERGESETKSEWMCMFVCVCVCVCMCVCVCVEGNNDGISLAIISKYQQDTNTETSTVFHITLHTTSIIKVPSHALT